MHERKSVIFISNSWETYKQNMLMLHLICIKGFAMCLEAVVCKYGIKHYWLIKIDLKKKLINQWNCFKKKMVLYRNIVTHSKA